MELLGGRFLPGERADRRSEDTTLSTPHLPPRDSEELQLQLDDSNSCGRLGGLGRARADPGGAWAAERDGGAVSLPPLPAHRPGPRRRRLAERGARVSASAGRAGGAGGGGGGRSGRWEGPVREVWAPLPPVQPRPKEREAAFTLGDQRDRDLRLLVTGEGQRGGGVSEGQYRGTPGDVSSR